MSSTENAPATASAEIKSARPTCEYCGNNPVPHFVNWYFESLNVALTPIRQLLIKNPLSRLLKRAAYRLNLSWHAVRLFSALGILSYQTDKDKCKVRRAQVLWEEAEKRGIEMKELLLFGKPFDMYVVLRQETRDKRQVSREEYRAVVFSGLPRPFNDSPASLDFMDDKAILKRLFMKNRLPVPRGGDAIMYRKARNIFRSIDKPVIVKPRVGSRGRHSTTFIYDEKDLKRAFKAAKQLCLWAMVEEQLTGPVYRATCINYECCGVLRGDSPEVTGDGTHTIEQLVEIKNTQDHPGVKDIVLDDRAVIFLKRQNLTLSSILPAGKTVSLTEKIGVNYGGSSSEDFDICHPDNKKLFEEAARVVDDSIVGFDFIIPDIAKSWKEQKCGFIEANSLPFINLHHDPLLGKPQNVAVKVLDMLGW